MIETVERVQPGVKRSNIHVRAASSFSDFCGPLIKRGRRKAARATTNDTTTYFRLSCMQTLKCSRLNAMQFRRIANRPTGNPFGSRALSKVRMTGNDRFASLDDSTEWARRCVQTTCDTSNHSPLFLANSADKTGRVPPQSYSASARERVNPLSKSGFEPLANVPAFRRGSKRRDRLTCSPVDWINSADVVIAREYGTIYFLPIPSLVRRII